MTQRIVALWKENKGILVFLLLMFVFRSSFADWNVVPTGSMKPSIVEGDRILVNKLAYDLRLPFSNYRLTTLAHPIRGDVIVFESKAANERLVKRVIGVPGDVVSMTNNAITINHQATDYQLMNQSVVHIDLRENLADHSHVIRVHPSAPRAIDFPAVRVPDDHYLVLGDNRNNSVDSRYIGFVPRDEIIGRSRRIVMSLNYDNYYLPRRERFLKPL